MSHVYSDYYSKDNFDFIKLNCKEIKETVKKLKIKFLI